MEEGDPSGEKELALPSIPPKPDSGQGLSHAVWALMARCEVQVAFDPANTFRALEPLRGIVRVDARESVPSKSVEVELRWRVRGSGNPGSQVIVTRTLHTGPH